MIYFSQCNWYQKFSVEHAIPLPFFKFLALLFLGFVINIFGFIIDILVTNNNLFLDLGGELEASGGMQPKPEEDETKTLSMRSIKSLLILWIVGKKLMINPNTYASLAGFVWALISFRWGIELPLMISNCISILSDGGLGMAMFSLGLFTASQSSIIACGTRMMVLSMGLRFIVGPALIAIPSYAIGMRATLLKVAIVQAALPQGIVPWVFAKEYGVQPDILSTGVIIGMIIAVPIALAYYSILDHN